MGSLNDPFEFAFCVSPKHVGGVPIDPDSLAQAKDDMKKYGILSFSEVNHDILMWSHYSAAHTGFCIQFERTDDNDMGSLGRCIPVIYDISYPTYSLQELENAGVVARIMTIKAPHWSYEREWRMLVQRGQQSHPFPGTAVGIVFGARMPAADRRVIAAIMRDAVTYSEALISDNAFEVNIKPLDTAFLLAPVA